jgi:hypothetical protein
MARYRIVEKTYAQPTGWLAARVFEPGEEIEIPDNLLPNLGMQPLDRPAFKAKVRSIKPNWRHPMPGAHPELWRLAKSLGYDGPTMDTCEAQAREFVEAWLVKHGKAA